MIGIKKHFVKAHLWLDLTLSLRGCQFWPTPGGGVSDLIPHPLGNQGMSCFKLYIAIHELDLFRNEAHMQKIGQIFKKLNEISRF